MKSPQKLDFVQLFTFFKKVKKPIEIVKNFKIKMHIVKNSFYL